MMTTLLIQPLFIGTTELLLIGGMALLLFGGKKLPEMMHGLGQGVKEFKKGMNEVNATLDDDEKEDENNGEGAKPSDNLPTDPRKKHEENGNQQR